MSPGAVPPDAVQPREARSGVVVLLDLVAIMLLVGLALVGLAGTFAGWQFLLVGLAGGALALLVVLSTQRLPVEVLVAALPVGAILFGGPVALREGGLGGGVPDAQLLAHVMLWSVTSWHELLTTLPWVDLSGPPALVPYLLGFGGAGLAGVLALRGRSAGLPLLPAFGVLVAVLLLRRPQSGVQDWYPIGFAVVAVVWLVLRGLEFSVVESLGVHGRKHGRPARAVAAAAVVTGALVLAVPATGGRPASVGSTLRGQVHATSELAGLDSPLRRFRTFTEQQATGSGNVHRKLLFTVTDAPRGSRVRMVTLDTYDGKEWAAADDTMRGETDDAFLRMDSRVDNPTHGRHVRVQVSVAPAYRSAWVPTIGSLTSLRFLFGDADSRREQLRYNLATSTAVIPVGIHGGNDYEFTAIVPDDRLSVDMRPWPEPVLRVVGLHAADTRMRKVLASPVSPMRKVFAFATYLRDEGRFTDGGVPGETQYLPGQDLRRLVNEFLLAPRPVGDDEQYAAAMALLANRVGVPARVVVGAVVPRDGKVRGSDVHAWVELRIADGTWRTLPTRRFMGDQPPRPSMTPASSPPAPKVGPVPVTAPPPPAVVRDVAVPGTAPADRRGTVLRWVPWLVLLLLGLVVPAAKQGRQLARRHGGRASDRMAGAWSEVVDHAHDLGVPVLVGATRPAQARSIERADEVARRVDHGVFAAAEPSAADVGEAWRRARSERRALSRSQRPWRRAWAPFNPASLVRPQRAGRRTLSGTTTNARWWFARRRPDSGGRKGPVAHTTTSGDDRA